jgi:hypothetical protein
MFRIEYNAETGKTTEIDLTEAEIAKIEKIEKQAEIQAEKDNALLIEQRKNKVALFSKLNITEDDAKLLFS